MGNKCKSISIFSQLLRTSASDAEFWTIDFKVEKHQHELEPGCVQMSEVQKPSLKTAKKIFLHFTKKCNKTKQVNLPSFVSGEIRSSGFSSKDLRVIPGRDCRADAIFSGEASCVLLGERSVRVYQLT